MALKLNALQKKNNKATLLNTPHHQKCLNYEDLTKKLLVAEPILCKKICVNCSINKSEVSALLCEVLRFLTLVANTDQTLTPSHVVDLAWHQFILFTRAYQDFCRTNFGRYIHHQPSDNQQENDDQFFKTLLCYRDFYGTPPPHFWENTHLPRDPSNCGACESV